MSLVKNLTRPLIKSLVRPITEFEPTEFSGNVLWLDAMDDTTITKDGSDLSSQWGDKSNSGYDFTSSGSNRPTYDLTKLNNKAALDYDGTDDYMSKSGITSLFSVSADFSIFIVFKLDVDDTTNKTIFASTINSTNRFVIARNLDQELICGTYDGSYSGSVVGFTDTTSGHIVGMTHTSADVIDAFLDGTQMPSGSFNTSAATNAITTIGAKTDGTLNFDGGIAEVIVYNRVLSYQERNTVTTYLGAKWRISVPDNGFKFQDGSQFEFQDGDQFIFN